MRVRSRIIAGVAAAACLTLGASSASAAYLLKWKQPGTTFAGNLIFKVAPDHVIYYVFGIQQAAFHTDPISGLSTFGSPDQKFYLGAFPFDTAGFSYDTAYSAALGGTLGRWHLFRSGKDLDVVSDIGDAPARVDFTVTDFGGSGSLHAVPEPAMWSLMLVGFGALGTALRRPRRRTHFVAAKT